MPLSLYEQVRRAFFGALVVPGILFAGVVFATCAFSLKLVDNHLEEMLLEGSAPLLQQKVLGGDFVGLSQTVFALRNALRWESVSVLSPAGKTLLHLPTGQLRIGEPSPPPSRSKSMEIRDGEGRRLASLEWSPDPIPRWFVFFGSAGAVLSAFLAFFVLGIRRLQALVQTHARQLGALSTQLVNAAQNGTQINFDRNKVSSTESLRLIEAATFFHSVHEQMLASELARERADATAAMATQVSHDIRSPLTALIVALEDPETQRRLSVAVRGLMADAIESIRGICEDLLTQDRETRLNPETTDVTKAISETAARKRAEFRASAQVQIQEENLEGPVLVHAEGKKLNRILSNLVNNAMEAIADRPGLIRLVLEKKETHAEISVVDNGPGISEVVANQIGHRAVSTKPVGNGLGLYDAYRAVDSWNGCIDVSSQRTEGTKVTLQLKFAGVSA